MFIIIYLVITNIGLYILKFLNLIMKNNKDKENSELVCYKCGSFNVDILNCQDYKKVFKCFDCGKVWIKRDRNGNI